jgi:hypothetical protein
VNQQILLLRRLLRAAVNSRFAGTVDERLWRLISCYAARGVTSRAELRGAPALQLSNAQRLLNVPVKSVQPDFSLAIHQDGDYPYSRSNARGLPFVGGTYANISTPGLTRHKVRQPHTYP